MAHRKAASGSPVITSEEWIKELEKYQRKNDAGQTSQELAEMWGVSNRIALERLRKLWGLGRIARGFRRVERIDGRPTNVAVYSLKP